MEGEEIQELNDLEQPQLNQTTSVCNMSTQYYIYAATIYMYVYRPTTVEPPNKGHIGDNINSAVLSFIEVLKPIGHVIFGTSNSILCREVIIQRPYFGGSTVYIYI